MAASRVASSAPRVATLAPTSASPVEAASNAAADPLPGALANIAGESTFEDSSGQGAQGSQSSDMVHGMVLAMVAEAADKARKETEHIKPLG